MHVSLMNTIINRHDSFVQPNTRKIGISIINVINKVNLPLHLSLFSTGTNAIQKFEQKNILLWGHKVNKTEYVGSFKDSCSTSRGL